MSERTTSFLAGLVLSGVLAALFVPDALSGGVAEIPDPAKTPGVIAADGHDAATVCGTVGGLTYSKRHRVTPYAMKLNVLHAYGYRRRPAGDWEIDHRIPLALGGADVAGNLWPQPGNGHGASETFHDKDRLETCAWERVCKRHNLDLATAQGWFLAADWREVWEREKAGCR